MVRATTAIRSALTTDVVLRPVLANAGSSVPRTTHVSLAGSGGSEKIGVSQPVVECRFAQDHPFPDLDAVGQGREPLPELIRGQLAIGFAGGLGISVLLVRYSGRAGVVRVVPPPLMAGVLVLTVAMCLPASFVSVRKALRGPGRQGRPCRLLSGERAVMDGGCETC